MHHNLSLHIGKINAVGDPNNKDESNRYRVLIPEDNIVTGWLFQIKRSSIKNQDDFVYDIDQPVVVMLAEDHREGFILGSFNNKNTPPKTTDKDTEQTTFSDGTIISYDRRHHVYTIDLSSASGTVIINQGNNGGVLNVVPVTSAFNALQDDGNQLKGLVDGWSPIPGDGGASLKTILSGWATALFTRTQRSDIEDVKVKH